MERWELDSGEVHLTIPVPLCLVILLLLTTPWAWAGGKHNPTTADDFPSEVASTWFDLLYDVVKNEQLSPPVASRIYGIAAVALYEAIVPGSREHRSLVGQLNDLAAVPQPQLHKQYHWPTVAHSALARAVRGLFPNTSQRSLDAINALERALTAEFQSSVPPSVYARSVAQGRAVARAMLAWASTDGFPTLNNCPYTPPAGPGLWVPTPPTFVPKPLQPCWGQLRPFVLTSSDACAPPPPPMYATDPASEFYALALVLPPASAGSRESTEESSEPMAEPRRIRQALRQTGGNVVRTARLLGLSRSALRYRMRRDGITRAQEEETATGLVKTIIPTICQGEQGQRDRHGPLVTAAVAGLTPDWERRPVVVMAVALTLPEDTGSAAVRYSPWTVTARWEQQMTETVQGFGGVMMQRSLALSTAVFGLPCALEQMVPRAVQAGLAIQRLVAEARTPHSEKPCPTVRLAVHVGTALVDMRASDPTAWLQAMGETLALPVQLLGYAKAGELLVSSQVRHQIEDFCVLQARALRLEAEPSARVVYSVAGLRPWQVAPGGTGERALSRFVGRERQLADLHAQLTQAIAGQGHVVGIVGEPGIGKSRLLYEFRRRLSGEHVTYVEGHCQSYGSTSPYLPVLDLLRQLCGITDRDSPDAMTAKIHAILRHIGLTPAETAPYLLHLLGLSEGTQALAVLSPETIRIRTFATLRQVSLHSSRQRPLIIAVENLHWVDTTSEAFFASLVEYLAGAPLLFLATYRPGYRPPWLDKSYATQIILRPLSPDESHSLVQSLASWQRVRAPLVHEILAKAEGNPFFLEELIRAALEHTSLTVPATIQGVLMARLDRLPEAAKRLVQTTAVLGRAVPHSVLAMLWDGPGELAAHLRELQRLEFLYTQADADDPVYCFKHLLTQEVAYESLPVPGRQALHAAAGRTLEARDADRLEEVAERLAYHYARSGEAAKAVTYLALCAAKAARSYAHAEVVTLLQEALRHVERLPAADQERRGLELALRQAFSLSILGRFRDILDLLLPHQASLEHLGDPAVIPGKPPSPVITVSSVLAFRKHRCENTP